MTKRKYPWTCPIPDCGYEATNYSARSNHIYNQHNVPGSADDDVLAAQVGAGSLSQDQGLAQAIATLTTEVREIKASLAGATPATPQDIPSMADVVAHCEGGACPAHNDQWETTKAQIVEAAYKDIPEDLVRSEATKLGMVHPSQILIKPVEVQS